MPEVARLHSPDRYPKGSAARTLAAFGQAWYRRDLYSLVPLAQRSWVLRTPDPYGLLGEYIQERELLGFLLVGRGQTREEVLPEPLAFITFADIPLRVWYQFPSEGVRMVRLVARLVYEGADGKPRRYEDPWGSWGVNPVSLLDEDRSASDMQYVTSIRKA